MTKIDFEKKMNFFGTNKISIFFLRKASQGVPSSVLFKVLGFGLKKTRLKKNYFWLKKNSEIRKLLKITIFGLKKTPKTQNFA